MQLRGTEQRIQKKNSASDTLYLANDDSFPDVDEYEPPKKAKKKNPPKKEPVDALAEKAETSFSIRVKLLKFKGPDDPLRKRLIGLFHQLCDRMRYIPRGQLKPLARALGASEREASILAEKAVKKVFIAMKSLGY